LRQQHAFGPADDHVITKPSGGVVSLCGVLLVEELRHPFTDGLCLLARFGKNFQRQLDFAGRDEFVYEDRLTHCRS
jgi:hypothetical protein